MPGFVEKPGMLNLENLFNCTYVRNRSCFSRMRESSATMIRRLYVLITVAFTSGCAALILVTLLIPSPKVAMARTRGGPLDLYPAAPQLTPTPSLTPSPTFTPSPIPTGVFDVLATVQVSSTTIQVGDTITVTVTVENRSVGCQYPIYDITLRQEGDTVFRFDSPEVLGPPGPNPAHYTLTAIRGGTVTLTALVYGERNCDGFWQWTYVYGHSGPLTVQGEGTVTSTPTVTSTATPSGGTPATVTPTPTTTGRARRQYLPVVAH